VSRIQNFQQLPNKNKQNKCDHADSKGPPLVRRSFKAVLLPLKLARLGKKACPKMHFPLKVTGRDSILSPPWSSVRTLDRTTLLLADGKQFAKQVTASTVDMGAMLFWLALAAWSRDR
jgi:hypothetical protein